MITMYLKIPPVIFELLSADVVTIDQSGAYRVWQRLSLLNVQIPLQRLPGNGKAAP